jgi:hypothetical protein
MKVIIAGGRNYHFDSGDIMILDSLHEKYKFKEIVSGEAKGADQDGELFAKFNHIWVTGFPADWLAHGKSAGPIRNEEMAKYADAVILFPGGAGTDNMRNMAIKYGLRILYDAKGNDNAKI